MVGIRQILTFTVFFCLYLSNAYSGEVFFEAEASEQMCTDPKYKLPEYAGVRCVPLLGNDLTGVPDKIRVVFPSQEVANAFLNRPSSSEEAADAILDQAYSGNSESQNEGGVISGAASNTIPSAGARTTSVPTSYSGPTLQPVQNTSAQPSAPAQMIPNGEYDSIVTDFETCTKAMGVTERCCARPEQCLGESVGADGSQNSIILGIIRAGLDVAGQAASISGACGDMKKISLGVAGINMALAGKCTAKINSCKDACREVSERATALLSTCERDTPNCGIPSPAPTNPPTPTTEDYRSRVASARVKLREISRSRAACTQYENYAQQQIVQATSAALTAQLMGLCKKAATAETPQNGIATNAFNIDCASPANASNPACQNACNRAGAQNDPACNPAGAGGLNFGDGRPSNLVDPNNKLGTGGIDEFELDQTALADANGLNASKISTSTPGGGANLPGGGGGGGGLGGFGGGGGGEGAAGFNPAGIGSSIRSGSGYINPQGRGPASVGGAAGAQNRNAKFGADGKPFNPKDYLPGGPLDPKRKLAGLASSTPEIGAVHGDIFRSITNRFYQICLRNGLYDCATLRKSGTQGN